MQTVLLVRHAQARDRQKWNKEDHLRPLTARGKRQAEAIAAELGDVKVASIRSSPAIRCVETVQPLADRVGVKVKVDEALDEGSNFALPAARTKGLHILCAHGDNIPLLLEELGIACTECKKGSMWMIKRNGRGTITEVAYVQPG